MEQTNKLLEKILELLAKNEARISTNEFSSEGDKLIEKAEKEGEEASKKIQSTFDRIHDKLFTVNGI